MRKKVKQFLVLSAGIIFIILGLVGLALPFLQGILFIAIGLILISISSVEVRLWIEKRTGKYPKLFSIIKKIEKWVEKIVGEV